jgi:hypothetical protein
MKKFKSLLSLLGATVCTIFLFSSTVHAISIQPVRYEIDVEPGKNYELEYEINSNAEAETDETFVAEIAGTKLSETGKKSLLEGDALENEPYYSVSSWPINNKFYSEKTDGQQKITVSFDVPEDTPPGTYYFFSIIQPERAEGDATFGVQARVASPAILTVVGEEVKEELILNSFELNRTKQFKFEANFTNNSVVELAPMGQIKIFNEEGKQVEGISTKTKTLPDGTVALDQVKDHLIFNRRGQKIPPNITTDIAETWENRTIDPGKYVAKLEGTYGREGSFSAETEFEISEAFEITSFDTDYIHSGLPVVFNVELQNNGDIPISSEIKLTIKGLLGNKIHSQDIDTKSIKPGEKLNIKDLEWVGDFALGFYTANLEVIDETGEVVTDTTTFFVINIWAIFITALIIAVLIFFIIKYRKLKSAVEKKE